MSVKRFHWYTDGMWWDGTPLPNDPHPTTGMWVNATDYDAQSLELQAVREALEGLFVACTTDSGAVLIGGAIAKARAALKQSRGAT